MMLERMRRFKGCRSDDSLATTEKQPKRQSKNHDFFRRLLGDRKKKQQPPDFDDPMKGQVAMPGRDDMGWETTIPSFEGNCTGTVQSRPTPLVVPSFYQDSSIPETITAEDVSSDLQGDVSGRHRMSLDARLFQDHVEVATGPSTGLSALFQQPTRLRRHSELCPSRLQNRPGSSSSTSPAPQTFLSITPSTSCSSIRSEHNIQIQPGNSEFGTSQARARQDQPFPASFQHGPITKPTDSLSDETDRNERLAHSLSYRIALAQVFMYQARMSDRPVKSAIDISGERHAVQI
ncbi:hypothetical protein F5Y11DRAFT_268481 [Daldinia sp. FL1419]|nr:hypothetical protein F5Y11DRAFT_268481 [Daldinia sp. FL1419]